jgi:hypothetical protein
LKDAAAAAASRIEVMLTRRKSHFLTLRRCLSTFNVHSKCERQLRVRPDDGKNLSRRNEEPTQPQTAGLLWWKQKETRKQKETIFFWFTLVYTGLPPDVIIAIT